MRPIKFRAWDKENNKYYEPTYRAYVGQLEDLSINFNGDLTMRTLEDPAIHESLFPDRFILQQYIGLKDKNGQEIYEGDIVKVIHDDGIETIGEVEWGLSSKGFGTYPAFAIFELESEMNSFSEIFDTGHYTIEVIGNICEDKHLLEVE